MKSERKLEVDELFGRREDEPTPELGALTERIFGLGLPEQGVVHVAAVSPSSTGLVALKINDETPKSQIDLFVLNAVRAWADVVLTSGKILREEPDLEFTLRGPTEQTTRALEASREDRKPRVVAVLSSGRGIAPSLLRIAGSIRPVVFTTAAGKKRLRGELGIESGDRAVRVAETIEVVKSESPGPRAMLQWARERTEWSRIAVELGPSTSAALYSTPALIDCLLLSVFHGEVPGSVVGAEFLPGLSKDRDFRMLARTSRCGQWSFEALRPICRRSDGR